MPTFQELRFPSNGGSLWAGMGDFRLISPDGNHVVLLPYEGEPPHGDSFHRVSIDQRIVPGYAWGCMFAFTADSRYLTFSWMPHLYDRRTMVVDVIERAFFVLPEYIYDFRLAWPSIMGSSLHDDGKSYIFSGREAWTSY